MSELENIMTKICQILQTQKIFDSINQLMGEKKATNLNWYQKMSQLQSQLK